MKMSHLIKIISICLVIPICGCLLLSNSNASDTQSNNLGIDYADFEIKNNNKKLVSLTYDVFNNKMSITPPHFIIIEQDNTYIYNNNSVLSYSKNKTIDANKKPIHDNEIRNKFNTLFNNIEKYLKLEICFVFGSDYDILIDKSSNKILQNTKYFKNKKCIGSINIDNKLFSKNIVIFNKNNTCLYLKGNSNDEIAMFTNNKDVYNTVPNNNKNANEYDPLLLPDNYYILNEYKILDKFKKVHYNSIKNAIQDVFNWNATVYCQ